MTTLGVDDVLAQAVTDAIQEGDVEELAELLAAEPWLARVWIDDSEPTGRPRSRSLLHLVTDWPGHLPRAPEMVRLLAAAGSDVNARFRGRHEETPLHWAASSDDVAVLDALLDAGADIEAPGAVIGGGSPLADARGFGQWNAAFRLVERGAHVDVFAAAALGLLDRLEAIYAADPPPTTEETDRAFWAACKGGRLVTAQFLHARGADVDVVPPWAPETPLDAVVESGSAETLAWLRTTGAHTAFELR